MIERPPDLATDIEYLLQSDQGSLAFLVEVLVSESYAWLHWLACALLDDPAAAHQAAVQALVQALAHTYQYRGGRGVQPWLAGFLLQAVTARLSAAPPGAAALPGPLPDPAPSSTVEQADAALLAVLDTLDLPARAAILLRYRFAWSPAEIAQVAHLSTGLPALLLAAEARFTAALLAAQSGAQGREPSGGTPPDGDLPLSSDLPPTGHPHRSTPGPPPHDLEQVVRGCLERRWPAPALSEDQLAAVLAQVEALAGRQAARRRRLTLLKETLLIGLTILVVALAFWGFNTFAPPALPPTPSLPPATQSGPRPTPLWIDNVAYIVQSGDTLEEVAARAGSSPAELRRINALTETQTIYPGLPVWVPVPEFAPGAPTPAPLTSAASGPEGPHARLSARSTPQEVSRRIAENGAYWKNLWADLQMAAYSLVYDHGEASAYRIQVWLWPPGRSLELYNDLSSVPAFRHTILNGRSYTAAGPYANAYLAPDWLHAPDVLLQSPLLRQMFFPGVLPAAQLKVSGLERVAGQQCVIVEYRAAGDMDPFHLRLWVDTHTGVILRRQQYDPARRRLLSDVIVTRLAYDVDMPADLFDPRRHWQGGFATDWSGRAIPPTYIEPTPTWALPKVP